MAFVRDDPITKFIPNLTELAQSNPSIDPSQWTVRSIMGHVAGLPANYPANLTSWPNSLNSTTPGPSLGNTTEDDLLTGVTTVEQPLPMWSWPMYSNFGYALVGLVNMAVATDPPATHLELLERDLFGPLGMNSTGINPDEEQAQRFAVASAYPSIAVSISVRRVCLPC